MAVLKTRMQPIGKIFNRFNRTVRDLARELGKEVRLVIRGADTELDKSVIDELGDPLIHLLRNAVDHGIEASEVRKSLGKKQVGVINLSAFHEGNHILIKYDKAKNIVSFLENNFNDSLENFKPSNKQEYLNKNADIMIQKPNKEQVIKEIIAQGNLQEAQVLAKMWQCSFISK